LKIPPSLWRGYRQRKIYEESTLSFIPNQKVLIKKYCFKKINQLNRDYYQEMQNRNAQIGYFIQELYVKNEKEIKKDLYWKKVFKKLLKRGEDDCAICCTRVEFPSSYEGSCRPIYITNCTHALHASCLKSLEKFSGTLICPICRSDYKRKLIGIQLNPCKNAVHNKMAK
jgi:hypothetical protein